MDVRRRIWCERFDKGISRYQNVFKILSAKKRIVIQLQFTTELYPDLPGP
jgi:hypothetical protein